MIRLLSQLLITILLLLLLCFRLSPIIPIDRIAIVIPEYSEIKDEINSKYCGLWCLKTLNNTICISVILWESVLLMKETGVPGENHRPAVGH
jgi:hypothetical protein